jgi:hypothetical protein
MCELRVFLYIKVAIRKTLPVLSLLISIRVLIVELNSYNKEQNLEAWARVWPKLKALPIL